MDEDDGGTEEFIIIRRHGIVIGACGADGDKVAFFQRRGQGDILLNEVAALTAAPGDRNEFVVRLILLICGENGVRRTVERVAGVVRHAAVDRDVGFVTRDRLDRTHGIECHARVGDDAPARLHEEARFGETERRAGLVETICDRGKALDRIDFWIFFGVSHAEPAAEVEHLCGVAEVFFDRRGKGEHDVDRALEDVLVKDLRADVAVEAAKFDVFFLQGERHDLVGLPGRDRNAELGIDFPRVHCLVGVGVNARGQANQDLLSDPAPCGSRFNRFDLLAVVCNEIAHAVFHRKVDIGVGFVVAVEKGEREVKAGALCKIDFARGDDVDAHPLVF